ncbi:MAG: hypothetical protein NUV78_00900, partial [Candidatus Zambryskibacteria bacterium]|nr:hypothetical protein [Candidatus Zambryskibacteria bacterium]
MALTKHSGQVGGATHKVRVRQIAPTDPTPIAGDQYFDQTSGTLYIHDGTMWWGSTAGTSTSTSTSSTSS